ncbi:unnamed protein product [Dibothriocephalus latus]|uniref:Uncharacterized protein n=1 Tax=Dibothriocephalus latus TaxID=60516 RepID=A0A3P6QS50_DIBLA|nr:unnamed protein product [Dibothriocephalus latus]
MMSRFVLCSAGLCAYRLFIAHFCLKTFLLVNRLLNLPCFLRWIQRLVSEVKPLRPLVCNAILGRYVEFSAGVTTERGVSASETTILPPGEMLAEQSLLARYFQQLDAVNRDSRKSLVDIIPAPLLQEQFYRGVFAIELIRQYDRIAHLDVDDKPIADDIFLALAIRHASYPSRVSVMPNIAIMMM